MFLSLALHIKLSKLLDVCISINIFSTAVHVFPNLFWKLCPLFGHILLTCLKCSRASFFPPSYSEKMRWDEVSFPVNFVKFLRTSFFNKTSPVAVSVRCCSKGYFNMCNFLSFPPWSQTLYTAVYLFHPCNHQCNPT